MVEGPAVRVGAGTFDPSFTPDQRRPIERDQVERARITPPPPAPVPAVGPRAAPQLPEDGRPLSRRQMEELRLQEAAKSIADRERMISRAMAFYEAGVPRDAAIAAGKYARELGVPIQHTLGNEEFLKQAFREKRFGDILPDSPVVREAIIQRPELASIIEPEELEELSRLEKVFRLTPLGAAMTAGAYLEGTADSSQLRKLQRSRAANLPAGLLGDFFGPVFGGTLWAIDAPSRWVSGSARQLGLESLASAIDDYYRPYLIEPIAGFVGRAAQQGYYIGDQLGPAPEDRNFIDDVMRAIGQITGQAATLGAAGVPVTVGATFTQGVGFMERMTEEDVDATRLGRDRAAFLGGFVTAATQPAATARTVGAAIPPRLAARLPGAGTPPGYALWDRFLNAFVPEFLQESFQSVSYDVIRKGFTDPDHDISLADAFYEGSVGGTAAAVFRSLLGIRDRSHEVSKAAEDSARLRELMDMARDIRLREQDPESFAELAQRMAERAPEGEASTHVYIDATTLVDVLSQAGMDQNQVIDLFPSLVEALPMALESDTSVAIPMGDLLAKTPGSDFEQLLLPHLRMREDGMSPAEADAVAQTIQEMFSDLADNAVENVADSAAWEAEGAMIQERFTQQLTGLSTAEGAISADAAGAYASLARSFFTVMAERLGTTPMELYNRFPLRVRGVEPGALPVQASPGVVELPGMLPGMAEVAADILPQEAVARTVQVIESLPEAPPVRLTPYQQATVELITPDAEALVQRAAPAKDVFDAMMVELTQQVQGAWYLPGPLKSPARVAQKAALDYDGDLSRVLDVVRSTIVAPSVDAVRDTVRRIQGQVDVVRLKDRIENPAPGGMRDVLMNVQLPDGTLAEIQVHVPEMLAAKEYGHALYERARVLPDGDPQLDAINRAQEELYGTAWERAQDPAFRERASAAFSRLASAANASGVVLDPMAYQRARSAGAPESARTNEPSAISRTGTPSTSQRVAPDGTLISESDMVVTSDPSVLQQAPKVDVPTAVRRLLKYMTPQGRGKITRATAQKILAALKAFPSAREMAAVAWAGRAKRGWYAKSAEALSNVFGPDAPRFAALLAATSPQTSVESNLLNALNVWKNWTEAGRPTDREAIIDLMAESVQRTPLDKRPLKDLKEIAERYGLDTSGKKADIIARIEALPEQELKRISVLPAWINNSVRALSADDVHNLVISGPKVNSFFKNLIGVTEAVTLDTWMANYALVEQALFGGALNVDGTDPGLTPGYISMSVLVRQAADQLTKLTGETWTPAEVQETVWSWAKALHELQRSGSETRDAVQLLEEGALTNELIDSVPDFSGLFNDPAYAQILEDAGYGSQLEQLRRAGADQLIEPAAEQGRLPAPEAAPFDPEAQRRFERRAAQRLAQLYGQEEGGKKVIRKQDQVLALPAKEPEPQFAVEPGDLADGYLAQRPLGELRVPERNATLEDFSKDSIHKLLDLDNWAILTAQNPDAVQLSPQENAARMAELRRYLDSRGIKYIDKAIGKYGNAEDSFVLVGVTEAQAREIGRRFQQDSVLTRKGLIYGNGTVHPARRVIVHDTRPEDFFTDLPDQGVLFTVDLNMDIDPVPLEATGGPQVRGMPGKPVVGYHYSRQARDELDGRFYGKGMRGAERNYALYSDDPRVRSRVYVYLDEGNGIRPESGVGYVAHTVDLSDINLYDAQRDPENFWDHTDPELREKALLDAGYEGYFVSGAFGDQGAAVILGERSHSVKAELLDARTPGRLAQDRARGGFSPARMEIVLNPNADMSTFLHEMGHFFLESMADMAADPNAPLQVRQDMDAILDWFGVDSLDTWNSMTLDQQRQFHEQFAESFEQYLFEGKAPSAELRGAFRRFRQWLVETYKSIQDFLTGSGQGARLNQEIRGVMARMIATDEQIQRALRDEGDGQLFQAEKPDTMTDNEWSRYHEAAEEAVESAVEMLQTRTLRDMQWLDRARSRVIKELQAKHKELRKRVEEEVRDQVRQDPVYAAWRWLRDGTLPDGAKTEGGKLDTQALRDMYGEDANAAWRWLPTNIMRREGGMHPDMVAEMFGFDSGDAMIRELLHAAPEAQQVDALTDQRMMQEHGDINSEQAMRRAADEAVHNEARARMVASEIKALRKGMGLRQRTASGGSTNLLMHAARQYAEQLIRRRGIAGLSPGRYQRAEQKAIRAAEDAMARGDTRAALQAKRNQLLNHYLAKAAMEARERVEKDVRYLRKFDKEGTRRNIDPDYLEQIDNILSRFDLRTSTSMRHIQRRQSLTEWVEQQRELGLDPAVDAAMLEEAGLTSYKQLSVEQFKTLMDSVRSIEHLGRLKNKLLKARDRREFNTIVDELITSITENARHVVEEPVDVDTPTDRVLNAFGEFIAMHRKLSSLARQMDGGKDGGPMWELLVRPLNEAMDQEVQMRSDATVELMRLMAPLYRRRGNMRSKVHIPEIGRSLSKEARIAVVLNMGNETNMQRLMDESGDNWNHEQLAAIARTLTAEELQTVQRVWDYIDSYWPAISEKQRRVTGVTPEKVEAVPLQLQSADGQTVELRGGYYPIKYDTRRSSRTAALEADQIAQQMRQGFFTRASTRRGHVESRQATVGRPVRKDLGVMFEHVSQVIHDLTLHEYLVDANRILRDKRVDAAIRRHYGDKTLKQMTNTLRDVAVGDIPAVNAWEGFLNHIRAGVSIAGMGWNLMTASVQALGLTQSVQRIGPTWVAKGMAHWVGDATKMESTLARIQEKSSFMRDRGRVLNREIAEVRNRVTGDKGAVRQAIEASYFWMLLRVQFFADVPTWQGMYLKQLAQGKDEATAIALADQAVRDTQGSGLLADMSAIQRGGPMLKLWTNFYNFFNTTFNLMAESVARTDFKNPMQVGKLAGDIFLLFVLPSFLSSVLYQVALGDWEDFDEEAFAERVMKDQISYLMGTMVGVRDASGFITGFDYSGPSGLRFYSMAERAARQWMQGEVDQAAVKATIDTAGILFHFPSTQVNRVWQGTLAVLEDDAPMKSIVYGPPRE